MNLFLQNLSTPEMVHNFSMEGTSVNQLYPIFSRFFEQFSIKWMLSKPFLGVESNVYDHLESFQPSSSNACLDDSVMFDASRHSESCRKDRFMHVSENLGFSKFASKAPILAMDNALVHEPTGFKELELEEINSLDDCSSLFSTSLKGDKKNVDQRKRNNNLRAKGKISKAQKKVENIKGQWSRAEDRKLADLVKQHGARGWSQIAEMLPGRVGKQCRERWQNHLRPDIKKGGWSEEEDKLLIAIHKEVGNKWSEIAKRLPWRSENTIKNHFNATKRRQPSPKNSRSRNAKRNNNLLQNYIRTTLLSSSSSSSSSSNSKEASFDSIVDDLVISDIQPSAGSSSVDPSKDANPNMFGSPSFGPKEDYQPIVSFSSDHMSHEEYSVNSILGDQNSSVVPFGNVVDDGNWVFDDQHYHHQMPYDLSMALMELEMKKENEFMAMAFQDFVAPF